jgi:predicted DNA-binding protein
MSLFRVNARISTSQNDWLDNESEKTGISKSGLVQLAVEQYISQKEAIMAMNNMHDMYAKLEEIQEELKEVKKKQE